jgi:hypothetical protein
VTQGAADAPPAPVEMIVAYDDHWRWDMAMYLYALDLRLYDGQRRLLASGAWNDSVLHGYRSAQRVVDVLVSDMLEKLKSRP